MTSTNYYETYWSSEGYCPEGQLLLPVRHLFERYIRPDHRCLDVGCGDGRAAGMWLKTQGCEYIGVDIAQNAVRMARSLGLTALQIQDASRLPFATGSFDTVVCLEVLEHLFDPFATAREIIRVLKPGGLSITTVPNVAYWKRRVDLTVFGRWNPLGDSLAIEQPWRDPHVRFFTVASLQRMLSAAGFDHVSIGGHEGSVIRDLPLVGKRVWQGKYSRFYRYFELRFPSLLGHRLNALAFKPRDEHTL